MSTRTRQCRTLLLAATVGAVFAIGVSAQGDTAHVPFIVNANATVRAELETTTAHGDNTLLWRQVAVLAGREDTLHIPLQKATGIMYRAQRQANAPAIIRTNGGKITINLPAQPYKNAEISLYSVNGKRLMHRDINTENAVNNIRFGNIATGIYLLSVRGLDGNAITASRLTHSGGSLNIDVALGNEARSPAPQQAKSVADKEIWTIKITATGWTDTSYTLAPVAGINRRQTITLRKPYSVKIGNQTWMAANLDIKTDSSWCGNNVDSNCAKYGRMYNWTAAKTACSAGWHLPSLQEWQRLIDFVGDSAGTKLKATSGWGWDYNKGGSDDYGFSALPGGTRESKESDPNYGTVFGETAYSNWWTSTEYNIDNLLGNARPEDHAYSFEIREERNDVHQGVSHKRANYRVRCIHD